MLERLIQKIVKVYVDPANGDDGLEGLGDRQPWTALHREIPRFALQEKS